LQGVAELLALSTSYFIWTSIALNFWVRACSLILDAARMLMPAGS
jgi:hypothetical protein